MLLINWKASTLKNIVWRCYHLVWVRIQVQKINPDSQPAKSYGSFRIDIHRTAVSHLQLEEKGELLDPLGLLHQLLWQSYDILLFRQDGPARVHQEHLNFVSDTVVRKADNSQQQVQSSPKTQTVPVPRPPSKPRGKPIFSSRFLNLVSWIYHARVIFFSFLVSLIFFFISIYLTPPSPPVRSYFFPYVDSM